MNALIVDTSVWVDFFRGQAMPELEDALTHGVVVLPPLVCAELLSAPLVLQRRRQLASMLRDLPLHPTPFDHWLRVGELRAACARRGLSVSTPDAHVAQCAIDGDGVLWTRDKVFKALAKQTPLRLWTES